MCIEHLSSSQSHSQQRSPAACRTLHVQPPRNAAEPAPAAATDAATPGTAAQQPHPEVLHGIDNIGALRIAEASGAPRPARLPLRLRVFARVPLVVSARLHGASGKPTELFGRLYLAS